MEKTDFNPAEDRISKITQVKLHRLILTILRNYFQKSKNKMKIVIKLIKNSPPTIITHKTVKQNSSENKKKIKREFLKKFPINVRTIEWKNWSISKGQGITKK